MPPRVSRFLFPVTAYSRLRPPPQQVVIHAHELHERGVFGIDLREALNRHVDVEQHTGAFGVFRHS